MQSMFRINNEGFEVREYKGKSFITVIVYDIMKYDWVKKESFRIDADAFRFELRNLILKMKPPSVNRS